MSTEESTIAAMGAGGSDLHKFPEHAVAIALIAANWTGIEMYLRGWLGILLKISGVRVLALWFEFSTVTTKMKLIRRLTRRYVPESGERQAFLDLIGKCFEMNSLRNKYMHARYLYFDDALQLIPGTAINNEAISLHETVPLNIDTLKAEVASFVALHQKVADPHYASWLQSQVQLTNALL